VVSTRATLDNPTILKTDSYSLTTTAWQCNVRLDYNTTYYWKVRAVNGDTYSAWSAAGAFFTEAPPLEAEPPPEPPPSPQDNNFNWTEWLMPMGGVMFLVFMLVMIAMLITMIILVVKVSKL
jgi:hypothetical protein